MLLNRQFTTFAGLRAVLEGLNHPFSHAITGYVIRSNTYVPDTIDFHRMRKFLASKLRTIVQCTGNPYLANSFRKMAIVVVDDVPHEVDLRPARMCVNEK